MKKRTKHPWAVLPAVLLAGIFMVSATLTHAAAPLAGTAIGNQASATYTDGSGEPQSTTSNIVTTIVNEVPDVALTADNNQLASPGSTVTFPHTVTNTGNGDDSFNLTALDVVGTDDYDFTSINIYPDADGDGLPDNFTQITNTGNLAAGEDFNFVVVAIVPGSAVDSENGEITVTATSVDDPAQTESNTDTATVSGDAVLNLTKSIDIDQGSSGDTLTYTITYTNSGNDTATTATITDTVPANLTYVADSARWSVSGATALTDADDGVIGTDPTITYDYGFTNAGDITAVISAIPPGQSGFITFQVTVDAGIAPQVINNQASVVYDDGDGTADETDDSNIVPFEVLQNFGVTIQDTGVNDSGDNADSDTDGTADDVATVAAADQGSTVTFKSVVTNTGNGTDTFNITLGADTFPAGTTFQLFQSDAFTPLTDSSGDGVPDTGPIATAGTYNVFVKANLPPLASGDNGGAGYQLTVDATSVNDVAAIPATDDTTDSLTTITPDVVDLTNDVASGGSPFPGTGADDGDTALGEGIGPDTDEDGANPSKTNTTDPGTTTDFTLVIYNDGATADTYDLLADQDGTFGTTSDLPAGWTVEFLDAGGGAISNTGVIIPGTSATVTARLTVPADQAPGPVDIYFQAESPTTGVGDIIEDQVDVNTVRALALTNDNAGQIFPGGSIAYSHILTNEGNVTEGNDDTAGDGGDDSFVGLTTADTLAGWSSVIYWDANDDGILDATDPVVTDLNDITIAGGAGGAAGTGLDAGESARLFVKVFAPLGAEDSDINPTTLTVAPGADTIDGVAAPAAVVNEDTTTVISGDVTLVKEQALDADADGEPDAAYQIGDIAADPGQHVIYRITVTNSGSSDATNIIVYDTTPVGSTYKHNGATTSSEASVTGGIEDGATAITANTISAGAPASGSAGSFEFNVDKLTPAASAIITFGVQIDN